MAGGMDLGTGGRGGKKALDTAINLVPFIDLMAVTISFLIMTAVWNQVGRIPVSQAGTEPREEASDAAPPMKLVVREKELRLFVGGVADEALAVVRNSSGKID